MNLLDEQLPQMTVQELDAAIVTLIESIAGDAERFDERVGLQSEHCHDGKDTAERCIDAVERELSGQPERFGGEYAAARAWLRAARIALPLFRRVTA